MPSSRRFIKPLAAIAGLILLSVIAVISLGEGFKHYVVARDGPKIRRRDTISFNMPWNPPSVNPKSEVKAISPAAESILDAVGKVAAALLDGGSDIASLAQGAISSLPSPVAGVPSQVPSRIQDVNSQVDQATGVVGGIVSAATGIVGSLLAETGASGLASALGGQTNVSTAGNMTASMTRAIASTSGLNVSSTAGLAFNVTSAPVLTGLPSPSSSTSTTICASMPTCTACPPATTETCTVTETWHSTHYESTATLFSFVAAFTYTCTETVSVCPKSSLYPLAPPNTEPPSPKPSALIACPDGALAKRQEDCRPTLSISNATVSGSDTSSNPSMYPDIAASHPCPNAGYSCSECPGGVFCPPAQTLAQDCICGYGWACGHCPQGWFCIPSPTANPNAAATPNTNAGINAGLVSSAAAMLGTTSALRATSSPVPTTMAGFTANLPVLSTTASALAMSSGAGPLPAAPTSSGPLNQATSTADLAGNIINNVNSALGNVNGLSGSILSSVMGQLSSVLGANFPSGLVNPTNLGAVTGPAGNFVSSATGVAGNVLSNVPPVGGNPAGGLIPTVTGLVGGVAGNVLSNVPPVGGNPAGGLIPTVTGLVGGVAGNVLSNVPPVGANPVAGLVPTATAIIGGVASNLLAGGVPGAGNPAGGLIPTAAVIIGGVNSDLLAAGIPVATPAQIFQPTVTIPVINDVLPGLLGKAALEITRTVIPQPLMPASIQASSPTSLSDEPNVISHLTITIQGTPTILPVVITVFNGKATVVPLVKMVVDGKEKDLPLVGVDLGNGPGKVEAAKGVLDGNGSGKRRRGRVGAVADEGV